MPKSRTTKALKDYIQIVHKSGLIVTQPKNLIDPIPLFCSVCTLSMSGELDKAYYKKYSCCSSCGMKWADMNQEKETCNDETDAFSIETWRCSWWKEENG